MNTDSIIKYIEENFSEKRKVHTYAVRDEALKLCEHWGADKEKAEVAALFHDMFRGQSVEVINMYVKNLGLADKYMDNPNLAHGKIAAVIMKRDYGVADPEIINAVSYHTTGRAGMSLLEKIIFIADAIEPNRDYPGVDNLRELAYTNLDDACIQSLQGTMDFLTANGIPIDKDSKEALSVIKSRKAYYDNYDIQL